MAAPIAIVASRSIEIRRRQTYRVGARLERRSYAEQAFVRAWVVERRPRQRHRRGRRTQRPHASGDPAERVVAHVGWERAREPQERIARALPGEIERRRAVAHHMEDARERGEPLAERRRARQRVVEDAELAERERDTGVQAQPRLLPLGLRRRPYARGELERDTRVGVGQRRAVDAGVAPHAFGVEAERAHACEARAQRRRPESRTRRPHAAIVPQWDNRRYSASAIPYFCQLGGITSRIDAGVGGPPRAAKAPSMSRNICSRPAGA